MKRRAFLTGTAGTAIFLTGCNQSGGSDSEQCPRCGTLAFNLQLEAER